MVTGSHNPPDYNGFKMMLGKAPFYGDADPGARRDGGRGRRYAVGHGQRRATARCLDAYVDRAARRTTRRRAQLKVGLGRRQRRGRARRMAQAGRRLPGEHILLNDDDRRHLPEPPSRPDRAGEPRADLQREVGARRLRSRHRLRRRRRPHRRGRRQGPHPLGRPAAGAAGARRAAARASRAPPSSPTSRRARCCSTRSRALGGKPLMWKTGHSLIKAKMAETGAPLAGEMSGHIFFADSYYGFDDALYAAVRLLGIVGRRPRASGRAARRAAAGDQHAGAALPLRRGRASSSWSRR